MKRPPVPQTKPIPQFPEPDAVIGNRNFWLKRPVREWLAKVTGNPPPPARDDDGHLVTTAAVREMCGNVSDMWIWRRRKPATAEATA